MRVRVIAAVIVCVCVYPLAIQAAGSRYTLFAGGDTMLGRWVPQAVYRHGAATGFAGIRADIANADLAMTNLESVVAHNGAPFSKGERRPYLYRAPPQMLDVLTSAGFDLVTTANNHAMDYGPQALLEQLRLLASVNIVSAGSGENRKSAAQPAYVGVGDVVLAVISIEDRFARFAATQTSPGIHHAALGEAFGNAIERALTIARRHAHLVVLSPHWGANWTDAPTPRIVAMAHQFIEQGGDAVLGHSSHHLHGVEVYRGKPIIYDMGSLFFDAVKQRRMRYSAGWLLEFDQHGFHNITVKPYRLRSSRTQRANRQEQGVIFDWIEHQSLELDSSIRWERRGDKLFLPLDPPAQTRRIVAPVSLPVSNRTRSLARKDRMQLSNAVVEKFPAGFNSLDAELNNGVIVRGYAGAQAVRPGYAFVFEVLLEAPGPMPSRWEAYLLGVNSSDGSRFMWRHPVADGNWIPQMWAPGQLVIDRTLVRPKQSLTPGIYDLFWGMTNRINDTNAHQVNHTAEKSPATIPVGRLIVDKTDVPAGIAGIDWSGEYPAR